MAALDPDDPTPLRDQLTALLRAQILSGVPGPGEQLTPIIPLARIYHVSAKTALDAVAALREEGLVVSTSQGTFVRHHNRPRMRHLLIPADADTDTLQEWAREHLGLTLTPAQANAMRAHLNGNPNRGSL
jgi:DNA-binding GntR family transcriptional regulator